MTIDRSISQLLTPDSMGLLVDIGPQEVLRLANALQKARAIGTNLSERHKWQPGMGECVCEYHRAWAALLKKFDGVSK